MARGAKMAVAAAAVLTVGAAPAPAPPATIPVMVLGLYHMGNPGQDLHNARIDPVTTPAKQAELAALAKRLARFRPTVIAVEQRSSATDRADPNYARFTPAQLTTSNNEVVQVGYRLAALTGARVIAIDEQDRAGEPSYFPFGPVQEWAKAHPAAQAQLTAGNATIAAVIKAQEADQRRLSVTQMLAKINAPDHPAYAQANRAFYYRLLAFGGGGEQPGAVLNGRWYTRNAVIWSHLQQATRPGDRVIVVYGAGHNYWLKHFARETPGFALVEAGGFLK